MFRALRRIVALTATLSFSRGTKCELSEASQLGVDRMVNTIDVVLLPRYCNQSCRIYFWVNVNAQRPQTIMCGVCGANLRPMSVTGSYDTDAYQFPYILGTIRNLDENPFDS